MALNLKVAELYADLTIRDRQFFQQLAVIKAALAGIKSPPIVPTVDRSRATASLNLLLQQLKAVQAQANIKVSAQVPRGGGGGGGGGRSGSGAGFGGGGFLTGVGQGVGLGYLSSPQQAAGMAVGEGLKAAVAGSIDLEAKFAEVRRVAGLSADETARLKRELMQISTVQPGATLDDLIKMADIGGRMGLAGAELTTFASGLAMVKNSVSGMETEDLANNMSRVLHVFNLGPQYIKGFGSALTAMDNATTASAAEILKITQGLSGTAAAIGLTLPQVVALSATLRDVGLEAGVASSSFSQIFRKMATETADFAKAAGVDAKTFSDAYRRDPMEALALLMKGLGDASGSIEKQGLLKELGLDGVRASGAILQLAQAFGSLSGRAAESNAEFTSLKSLMAADALKGETTAAALGKLGNAAASLADSVGSQLLPDIRALTDGLTDMAKAALAGEAALDRAAQRSLPKGLDWLANKVTPAGWGRDLINKVGGGFTGSKVEVGKFNGFQRFSNWLLGTPAAAAPPTAPGAKPPALPAKPAVAAPKLPDPAGLHAFQGLASKLGLTVDRTTEKGGLTIKGRPGGGGLLGNGAGQLALGFLQGNLGAKLGGLNQLSGGVGGELIGALLKAAAPAQASLRAPQVGLSGAEVGRQLQEDALTKKADEQLDETRNLGKLLAEIRDLTAKAGGQVAQSVLAPP